MSKPWYKAESAQYAKERTEVEAAYPNLHFYEDGETVWIKGSFPVIFEGQELDRYLLEIKLERDYPRSFPVVWETGGRIPQVAEFHINPQDGTSCVLLPDERWRVCPPGSTLLQFLNGPVRNFFLCQSLVQRGDPWPFGQWDHGGKGIREYYAAVLGTDDVRVILGFLNLLTKKKVKGHWSCPCRSGRRLRDCHQNMVRDLATKIPRNVASNSLSKLRQEYNKSA